MTSAAPPSSVVLNVTETAASGPDSFLTVYPDGATRPNASDLNFGWGQTVPNLVVARLSPTGAIDIYNNLGTTDVVVDVYGWFS
jgi:hypothetical protein